MNQQIKPFNLSFDVYWLSFIRTCLRPLVRILVKQKVEFNSFQNLVKELFVEEAETYINETTANCRGKISSIAYQTGLDRREVSKIKNATEKNLEAIEQTRSREAAILEHWHSIPPFCSSYGKPLPLKRSGKGLSFETLVQRVGKNISHGPILEALVKANCVAIEDNKVHFKSKVYIPKLGVSKEKLNIASLSIKRIIKTIQHNLDGAATPNFQRNIYSINIPKSKLSSFKSEIDLMIKDKFENIITPEFDSIEEKHEKPVKDSQEKPVGISVFYFED